MGYTPNLNAISLQTGRSNTIGVVVPSLSEPFFAAAISGIENIAQKRGYKVLFTQSFDNEDREKTLIEKMFNYRVDGLLVSLAKSTSDFSHFNLFKSNHIPLVFFDCVPQQEDIHFVMSNLETGTIEAINYLLQRGHRRIGFINGPSTLSASKDRLNGYFRALTKNRLKFDPTLIVNCDLTEEGARNAINYLFNHKRKPTAVVTFNDRIALYAINHAKKIGFSNSGKNIEFVSYSNMPLLKLLDCGPVASVELYPYRQGEKSAEILIDLIYQKNEIPNGQTAYFRVYIDSQLIEK